MTYTTKKSDKGVNGGHKWATARQILKNCRNCNDANDKRILESVADAGTDGRISGIGVREQAA